MACRVINVKAQNGAISKLYNDLLERTGDQALSLRLYLDALSKASITNTQIERGNLREQIEKIANNSNYEHNRRLAEFLLDYNFGINDFFRFSETFAENFEEYGVYYKDEKGVKNISIKANTIAKDIPVAT